MLTPLDDTIGSVAVAVNYNGTIVERAVTLKRQSPSLLHFDGVSDFIATHPDYSLAARAWLYPGISTPAQAGETIILWGVGFGLPQSPLTAGAATQSGVFAEPVVCTVDNVPAATSLNLVSPGLYQINLTVPRETPSGTHGVPCTYRGLSLGSGYIETEN